MLYHKIYKKCNIVFYYSLNDLILSSLYPIRDLGIILSKNLIFPEYYKYVIVFINKYVM